MENVEKVLKKRGMFVFTFFRWETDDQKEGWTYPSNVAYRSETIADLAFKSNLHYQELDWYHPNKHTWGTASIDEERLDDMYYSIRHP